MKTIFKYALLAMAIVTYPPFEEEEAEASPLTMRYVPVCSFERIWIPLEENEEECSNRGFWKVVKVCKFKKPHEKDNKNE